MCCQSLLPVTEQPQVGTPQVDTCISSPGTEEPSLPAVILVHSMNHQTTVVWPDQEMCFFHPNQNASERHLMCPGPASLAPALLAPSLKPGFYVDHPSLAARLKSSQATREQSSGIYALRRRTNTPSQSHGGKVKVFLSCAVLWIWALVLHQGRLLQHTEHREPRVVTVAFLKHLALNLCKHPILWV